MFNNLYDILGARPDIQSTQLRPAFLYTASKYRHGNQPEQMNEVIIAYKSIVRRRQVAAKVGEESVQVYEKIVEEVGEDAESSRDGYR